MDWKQYIRTPFSPTVNIEKLYMEISSLFHQAQLPTLQTSHTTSLNLYWKIGRLIVEAEYRGNIRDHQEFLSQHSKWQKKPVTAIGLFSYLNNLLKIMCMKGFSAEQIKKAYCGLLNKEAW